MIGLLCFVLAVLASPFKSKLRLEAENTMRRHQLIVLRRRLHGRVRFTNNDRWFLIQLYRWFPSILQVLTIIRPETLVRCPSPDAYRATLSSPANIRSVPHATARSLGEGQSCHANRARKYRASDRQRYCIHRGCAAGRRG